MTSVLLQVEAAEEGSETLNMPAEAGRDAEGPQATVEVDHSPAESQVQ